MAADAVVVPIPPPPPQPEEKDEDEQLVPPSALPQPLESGPGPADKGDETSQTKIPFKAPCPVDEGDDQIPEGNILFKVHGRKETRQEKILGSGDERDKEIWHHQSPEDDDCDDYLDIYSEHLFRHSRYPMYCHPSYHDNPLHYANGYFERNGYPGYRHVGYPFRPYDHGYRNQHRLMNPLHDERKYAKTSCCSRNLVCRKKDCPVGASLSNPEKWICFLNCILQCVVHTVPLVLKLLNHRHLGQCPNDSGEFCCYCSLRHHASEVIRLSGDVLYPRKFVRCLKLVFRDFERGQHQDAHEFLRCLLDKLDEASVAPRSSSEEPSSIVKEIFGGQLKSQLHCPECNHCSDRLESFLDLNLEVNQMDTVMDSLRSFTKIEVVEDFICDGCKSRVNMEKRLKVEQAPEVLVIQLKRFQNLGCNISKIHDMVKYELELDLNPFMSSPDDKPQNYDLYGVVEHLGNTYKGHYVCYIRSSETDWFLFDDDKVMKMTEDRLLDNKAYLLFYVKQGSAPWFSTLLERKDTLLSGYFLELLEEGLDENGLSIEDDEGSYSGSGSDSDEQDTAEQYFGGPAQKNEAGPSSAGLSRGVLGNANGSTMISVPDKKEVSCNLGGGLSGETEKHTSELGLCNKENLSPQGSHGTREMSHSIHGQVHAEGSHGGSSQENGTSCNLLQSSADKHEDDCCPDNLTLHKDGMRGSCDSSAGSPHSRKRILTSRFRTVGPNSNRTTKGERNTKFI
uniref:Uncharacterized protein n=1 Tax=Avena sativa TaxID=4498 RepID=A0ACD5THV6_AVESA